MISCIEYKNSGIILDCQICLEDYNIYDKKPIVLDCGHSICQDCCKQIFENIRRKCPFDNSDLLRRIEQYPVNWSYIDIITSKVKLFTYRLSEM
jgi:hypothetical protein